MPDFRLEKEARRAGFSRVAGVDEAGRGPWAGPVVAGAVVIEGLRLSPALRRNIDDSKRLTPGRRETLFEALCDLEREGHVRIGVGRAAVWEIDAVNILEAALRAMARAVGALGVGPDLVLVDGNREPALSCSVRTVVKGDARSLSIAAASIVAKVTRDRLMQDLARDHPGYGWERNAGYGTRQHRAALARLGITPQHRASFAPIAKILRGEAP